MIDLRVERRDDGWVVVGADRGDVRLVNDYLRYLGDRHYAPGTRRGYAFDLLALLRWLAGQDRRLDQVDTEVLLRFLGSCRSASTSNGAGGEAPVDGRREGLAAATVNRRLATVSGLFAFPAMRDPERAESDARGCGGPAGGAGGSGTGCLDIWPGRSPGRRCGCASRGGCPARWPRRRRRRCWRACARGGIGRSPG
ncbi:MAG: site-specific integrase [Pseudonocardia sp.]